MLLKYGAKICFKVNLIIFLLNDNAYLKVNAFLGVHNAIDDCGVQRNRGTKWIAYFWRFGEHGTDLH